MVKKDKKLLITTYHNIISMLRALDAGIYHTLSDANPDEKKLINKGMQWILKSVIKSDRCNILHVTSMGQR